MVRHPGLDLDFSNTQLTAITDGANIAEVKEYLGEKALKVFILNNQTLASVILSALEDSIETRSMAMKIAVDEASATVTYVGEASTGAALSAALWRIKRITVSGTVTIIEWANGNGNFTNVWNNRASLTYS